MMAEKQRKRSKALCGGKMQGGIQSPIRSGEICMKRTIQVFSLLLSARQ